MERMTVKRSDGRWALANNDRAKPMEQIEKITIAVDRLAAYEDTGLEPGEVLTGKELAEVWCAIIRLKEYQDIGSIAHLRELSQAEQDGRLMALSCKLGQEAWFLNRSFYNELCPATVVSIELNYHTPASPVWVMVEYRSGFVGKREHRGRWDLMFGKTVFLTREDAEAALKKREADNERI